MKTFEERYTEWIDGELRGDALADFEAELARRAQAGEAQADKVGAVALRALLRESLQAPPFSNAEFFNHQLRESIERGRAAEVRPAPTPRAAEAAPGWSWWSFAGVVALTAVFIAVALNYAMVPRPPVDAGRVVAVNPAPAVPAPAIPEPPVGPIMRTPDRGPMQLAKNDVPEGPDLQAQALDQSTSATPLNYKVPNKPQSVQVLWMNGLEYQPDSEAPAAAPSPQTAP